MSEKSLYLHYFFKNVPSGFEGESFSISKKDDVFLRAKGDHIASSSAVISEAIKPANLSARFVLAAARSVVSMATRKNVWVLLRPIKTRFAGR
jgi:hypothetical protein